MGGSSLGPEVLARPSAERSRLAEVHVLDSTDPAQIAAIEQAVDARTRPVHRLVEIRRHARAQHPQGLFLRPRVGEASAQGEGRRTFRRHHRSRLVAGESRPRTGLRAYLLRRSRDRRTLLGAVEIRLVPAAAMGLDVEAPAERRRSRWCELRRDVPPAENPGVQLGIAWARWRHASSAATRSRSSPRRRIAPSAPGSSNCIAESTGKHGKGLIPMAGEPLTARRSLRQRPRLRARRSGGQAERRPGFGGGAGAKPAIPWSHLDEDSYHIGQDLLPLGDRHRAWPAR
jgi:transaldolase/glucose-6-phosphate isomerase